MTKYHAKRTEVGGEKFDSKREANRWLELQLLLRAEQISDLKRQVKFEIKVERKHIANYFADFVYFDNVSRRNVVEDSKGYRTPEYRLKKKLVEAIYGIVVTET